MIGLNRMDPQQVNFLYGVARSLVWIKEPDRLRRLQALARSEAQHFLEGLYRAALEDLFELADGHESDTELLRRVRTANRDDPTKEALAAAAYLHASNLRRRAEAAGE